MLVPHDILILNLGKSTHNQRIECLWRDLYEGLGLFYQILRYLETNGFLDVDNDPHMWCLHYVYLPMLNTHLQNWKNAWVYHPLRTEHNKSPMQFWISGLHFTHCDTGSDTVKKPRAIVRGNISCVTGFDICTVCVNVF